MTRGILIKTSKTSGETIDRFASLEELTMTNDIPGAAISNRMVEEYQDGTSKCQAR